MVNWVKRNVEAISHYNIICTGTTGRKVQEALESQLNDDDIAHIQLTRLKSGPLGGDQQLGAMISEGKVDFFIFFWDTMTAQPHDVDVKALLRIATMYNVPTAMNVATADFLISSNYIQDGYDREHPAFDDYQDRKLEDD